MTRARYLSGIIIESEITQETRTLRLDADVQYISGVYNGNKCGLQ